MSDDLPGRGPTLGGPVASEPGSPDLDDEAEPDQPARSSRLRWLALGAVVLLLVGATVIVLTKVRDGSSPSHPASWDPRVAPFVAVVEEQRGLSFDHPVYVDFLSSTDFLEQSRPEDIDIVGQDRPAIDRSTRLLRALGLLPEDLSLYNSENQLRGSGAAGSYSYVDQRIRLRASELSPAVQSTLVHELSHALQDQEIDLGGRLAALRSDPNRLESYSALLEGDAQWVESSWRSTLSDKERRALGSDIKRQALPSDSGAERIPVLVRASVSAPYVLAESLVTVARENRGDNAVDDLFLTPPSTQEHLLDPWTLIEDHQGYLSIREPKLSADEEPFDTGTFGAVSWLLMLADRIPATQALSAASGWGGDSFAAFERDGNDCITMTYAGDTPRDREEMFAALKSWVRKAPEDSARVRRAGERLDFETCETGAKIETRGVGSRDALSLAVLRTHVSLHLIRDGMRLSRARCASDRLVQEVHKAKLEPPDVKDNQVAAVVRSCIPNGAS